MERKILVVHRIKYFIFHSVNAMFTQITFQKTCALNFCQGKKHYVMLILMVEIQHFSQEKSGDLTFDMTWEFAAT